MANRSGRAIRFHESKVREMGRVSTGVRGMTLDGPADEVVGMICMPADTENSVMVLSERGYGKRTPLDVTATDPESGEEVKIPVYRVTNRGGKGVKTLNITEKTGALVAIKSVNDSDDLVIINQSGITLRVRVADIRTQGRATQGVRIINLDKRGDQIASVCCVDTDPDEEADTDLVDTQAQEIEGAVGAMLDDMDLEPIADDADDTDDADDDDNNTTTDNQ